jgi:hypothetical protein
MVKREKVTGGMRDAGYEMGCGMRIIAKRLLCNAGPTGRRNKARSDAKQNSGNCDWVSRKPLARGGGTHSGAARAATFSVTPVTGFGFVTKQSRSSLRSLRALILRAFGAGGPAMFTLQGPMLGYGLNDAEPAISFA